MWIHGERGCVFNLSWSSRRGHVDAAPAHPDKYVASARWCRTAQLHAKDQIGNLISQSAIVQTAVIRELSENTECSDLFMGEVKTIRHCMSQCVACVYGDIGSYIPIKRQHGYRDKGGKPFSCHFAFVLRLASQSRLSRPLGAKD